jgi:acyl carrier protein
VALNDDQIRTKVREFIIGNFYVAEPAALTDDMSLLDAGIIDSTGVMEVITYLESEFSFAMDDKEMVPDNLDGISNITKYVQTKTA